MGDAEKDTVKEHLLELIQHVDISDHESNTKDQRSTSPVPLKKRALDILLGDDCALESNEDIAKHEVLQYITEKPSPRDTKTLRVMEG